MLKEIFQAGNTKEEKKEEEKEKRNYKNKPKIIKKMAVGRYISIITLTVDRLTAPIKRHRLAE